MTPMRLTAEVVTLVEYATMCREMGRPFEFAGSAAQRNGLMDMTDGRLLAQHLECTATTPAARSSLHCRQRRHVPLELDVEQLAGSFGISAAPFSEINPLETHLADAAPLWTAIAQKCNLAEPDLGRLASAWHTDANLGRPIEVVTDMSKRRELGFLAYQATNESFFDFFARLRGARVIP